MIGTQWRPNRPDPEHRRCHVCERVFVAGGVAAPMESGPYKGRRVCRDCRHLLYTGHLAPPR